MTAEALKDELQAAGIEYATGLERFMGNQGLYHKFLKKFVETDNSYADFCAALAQADMEQSEKTVHTLKGTSGNLGLMTLYHQADAVVQAIRAKSPLAEVQKLSEAVTASYNDTCAVLKTLLEE